MEEQQPEGTAERWIEHTVSAEESGRMVREILLRSLRLSRQMLKRLAQGDGVRLNGTRPFYSTRVGAGDLLAVRLSFPESSGLRPVPMDLDVAHEDADLLVVNKPPGVLVHPTHRSHIRTLAHGVLAHLLAQGVQARVHTVHRLDRDTSGLVLFAKHPLAHQRLDRQLRSRGLRRAYLALVHGVVPATEGEVEAPIGRHPGDAHLRAVQPGSGAVARTRFHVLERFADATLLRVQLDTGRTHQIRVHLAHLGHPLVGDPAYGGEAGPLLGRQALHAFALCFAHPMTAEALEVQAPVPADLSAALERLRAGEDGRTR